MFLLHHTTTAGIEQRKPSLPLHPLQSRLCMTAVNLKGKMILVPYDVNITIEKVMAVPLKSESGLRLTTAQDIFLLKFHQLNSFR